MLMPLRAGNRRKTLVFCWCFRPSPSLETYPKITLSYIQKQTVAQRCKSILTQCWTKFFSLSPNANPMFKESSCHSAGKHRAYSFRPYLHRITCNRVDRSFTKLYYVVVPWILTRNSQPPISKHFYISDNMNRPSIMNYTITSMSSGTWMISTAYHRHYASSTGLYEYCCMIR